MKTKVKIPNLVTVLIFTLITSVVWVFFSVYRALTAKPNFDIPPQILSPLSPTLDKSTIDNIEGRTYFEDSQIPESKAALPEKVAASPSPTEAPTATIVPESTESPTPEATSIEESQ
jgi:hypothetical protein